MLLWVLADKQMRSYYESMGKEDKIGTEAFEIVPSCECHESLRLCQ